MKAIVIDEKTDLGKLLPNVKQNRNSGRIVDMKDLNDFDTLIRNTEIDIEACKTKKIRTADLWK